MIIPASFRPFRKRSFGPEAQFPTIPLEVALAIARQHEDRNRTAAKPGGYDPLGMAEMQASMLFPDPQPAKETWDHGHDDLAQAIRDTVSAT